MRQVTLPDTDLVVSSICLGCGGIGSSNDRDASFRLLNMFVDLGGTFLDTASVYADWLPGPRSISEKTIGEWFAKGGKRDQIVLGTKGGHPDLSTMHVSRLSRDEIVHDLDASLRNLRTDVIDIYWLHRDDESKPAGALIEILAEQVRAGKIRHYGCSNWRAVRIEEAQTYAAEKGLSGFVADQMMWSLATVERENVADKTTVDMDDALYGFHKRTRLTAVPYSSQAGGLFQKMAEGALDQLPASKWAMYDSEENRARFLRAQDLAAHLSTTNTAIGLGYLLSQPFTTIPIIGSRTPEQLRGSMQAGEVQLSVEEVAYLEGRGVLT